MADCSVLGPNYSEDPVTGACIYTPSEVGSEDFPGTIESLGFSEALEGTTWEDDPATPELEYARHFDPYIKQKEDILKRHALGDVSQLGEGWELLQKQLSETLGLEYEETGLKSRAAYGKLGADKTTARDKTGMFYHGGLEKRIGAAESNIMEGYRSGRKASKSVYEQSIDTEARKHRDAVTDIYEKLELGIYDLRYDWKEGERQTLDDLLLSGIFHECDTDADCGAFGSCANGRCDSTIDPPTPLDSNIIDPQIQAIMEIRDTLLEGYGLVTPPLDPEVEYDVGGGTGLLTYPNITIGPTSPDYGVTPTPPGTSPGWGYTSILGTSSDRRLKENIELVGKSSSGINVYQWNYKSYPGKRYQGVMADEVPNASVVMHDGYLAVDYSKVDVDFVEV
jgi:hypothetical protein